MQKLQETRIVSFFRQIGLVLLGMVALWSRDLPGQESGHEAELLHHIRQLTFEGKRAGEGYFSADGTQLIFQSERDPRNPFFQIFRLDFETGDVQQISPGTGKTTCSWIHPLDPHRILFASTHADPQAKSKQQEEIDKRARGEQQRYSWDYDENYELYVLDETSHTYTNLTNSLGYDAEGSYSPDGKQIVFASNRTAYAEPLSEPLRQRFELDKSLMMDIYLMDADGSHVRRLTDVLGYDGGPFFSADGKQICWRRFSEDGVTAEVMVMDADGSNACQLTRLGAMSWAPFFHPSGDYLIFTTNKHGFGNFELYLVSADGKATVRVTDTDGFDGLPAFSPDGKQLAWTSNRTPNKDSQLFIAEWDDARARSLLGLASAGSQAGQATASTNSNSAPTAAKSAAVATSADFRGADILRHVDYLCRPELEGRLTGTPGEKLATEYVAAFFDALGLEPAGDDGGWFQTFPFTSGVALGKDNRLTWNERQYKLDEDFRPLAFAKNGVVPPTDVVFAGYGLQVSGGEGPEEYDSYVHLDVKDKWVLVFRFLPEDISPERRRQLTRNSHLRFKTTVAMQLGAKGLIVVSGPNSQARRQLVPLASDGTLSGSGIPVMSVTDQVAEQWLAKSGKSLKQLQDTLDRGEISMGFTLEDIKLSASVDVVQVKSEGRNVLGRLPAASDAATESLVIGAHVDHLGRGGGGSSLARDDEEGQIHYGADDNASGVAAMLEVAQYLTAQSAGGKFRPTRNVIFAAWSGEELGLLGSNYYVTNFSPNAGSSSPPDGTTTATQASGHPPAHPPQDTASAHTPQPNSPTVPPAGDQPGHSASPSLHDQIAAYLNFDMVGRLDDTNKVVLQGVGSSTVWPTEIERRNAPVGLPVVLQRDSFLPTDSTSFFTHGVPAMSAFTGSHEEYHTPRDTPETLNYDGAARIARLMALIARSLASAPSTPDYISQSQLAVDRPRAGLRAYLGTIPDYSADVKGVKISGASAGAPAERAGLKGGDIIVELAGKKIENIYDYTFAIEALKIGKPVTIAVQRGNQRLEMQITPGSRE